MAPAFGETANPDDVTRRPGPWPEVNQRIEIFGSAWGAWLPSRVEDRRAERLTVAVPEATDAHRPVAPPADAVALRWTDTRGIGMVEARVGRVTRAGVVAAWELVAGGHPVLFQRRRYARVPVVMSARVTGLQRRRTWAVTILDLAEGGLRCLAPPTAPFDPAEPVRLSFDVDGASFATRAQAVRFELAPGGVLVAFRFDELPRSEADRLRRFVFRQELAGHGAR
jgi:c-di-GMP-binding flagellar brake protein YcgR